MSRSLTCFKAYDVRGRIPDDLDADLVRLIGRAYARFLEPRRVVIGRDIRLSSAEMAAALAEGITAGGADVYDIGLCGTEEVYFATFHERMDGGIMITASHNPPDYNGLKFVREQSRPISADTGLQEIRRLVEQQAFGEVERGGQRHSLDVTAQYVQHLLGYVDVSALAPLKIVVNAGNGGAGATIDRLAPHLPFEFVRVHHEPDGTFPNGVPNPLLPENRAATADVVREAGADMGIAWDGDFDRCFLFDEQGTFIEGYYIVGLLASSFLEQHGGSGPARIVHDPRLTWNTLDVIAAGGGEAVLSKSGHAFIKETMRRVDAVYGGEMSAHHYFRDFSYADSGMIPWLLVAQIMSRSGKTLSKLVGERIAMFPASGEINRRVGDDTAATLEQVERRYAGEALAVDRTDGLSMEFEKWRFNLRPSNTEPLVRLNVESRGDVTLMEEKTADLLALLDSV